MRGIAAVGAYIPHHRLARSAIAEVFGGSSLRGQRSVASHDEDTTTMGVAAARQALVRHHEPDALWFTTAEPAYLEKTNACALHAALGLDESVPALDMGGAVRSGLGGLRAALDGAGTVAHVTAGLRLGRPTGADEAAGGDGAAAIVVADTPGPLLAEYLGGASATEEFIDRWRLPHDAASRQWEERFGETRYLPLAERAWKRALDTAGVGPTEVARVGVTGVHARAVKRFASGIEADVVDVLSGSVGNTGAAAAGLLLTSLVESAEPGQVLAVVGLSDGADVVIVRATAEVRNQDRHRSVEVQAHGGAPISYGTYLRWRGLVDVEPPNRPPPARISAAAAARSGDWKYGFVGSRGSESGTVHLPPARVSMSGDPLDASEPAPMADVPGTIRSFTVDRLAYSPSPPVVFAVVDFDGGGRLPVELTDTDPEELEVGDRVEMTFRRLYTADGIHNYFWKARPIPGRD